jgi:2-amino-4-hydroxy-6-hydroxymethyldihydropteridine diphosphokinase/dihydropteroate synthase
MVYISLGSNLGNRINNLRTAAAFLIQSYLRNTTCSIVLETEAVLPENAPIEWNKPFLNMIVSGETELSPHELLAALKSVETEMGRPELYEVWSPRIIDLDILLWDELVINSPALKIPHPELNNRPFLQHLLALMGVKLSQNLQITNLFKKSFVLSPQLVGVVNVTHDSFSDGGNFSQTDKAIQQVLKLAADGASIIEIGAQSTRPGAIIAGPDQEYNKLKPVLDNIIQFMHDRTLTISVDTFWPTVISKLLKNYPVAWVNDVKGELDDETLKLIAAKNCKLCLMHSLTIPPTKEIIIPIEKRPTDVIVEWGKAYVDRLLALGFSLDQIILDPGIGFGKSIYQNIEILQKVVDLQKLGVKIMIGHSRKSYFGAFSGRTAAQRDIETIAVSCFLAEKVDFLRVHNVEDHMHFLTVYKNFVQRK